MNAKTLQAIQEYAPHLDGVFTMADLKILFGNQSEAALYKKLAQLVREKILVKVKRGIYAVPSASLETISNRINPQSYISLSTVLAQALVIGSIPARRVQAVKVGWPRSYPCAMGVIDHLSIKPSLFFGFEHRDGMRYALPEKAFLDACYFHSKGRSLSFDPVRDINLVRLDKARLREYLTAYDQRFAEFVNNTWEF